MNQPPYVSSNMCEDCMKHLKNIGCYVPCAICKMKECLKCKLDHSIRKNTIFCKRVGCFRAVHDKTDFCKDCTDSRTFLKECIKNVYKQLKMYKKEFKRFDKNSIVDSDDDDDDDDSDGCVNELQYVPTHSIWFPKNPFINNNVIYRGSTNKFYNGVTDKEIPKEEFNNFNVKCTYSVGPEAREVSKEEFDNHPSNIKNINAL